MVEDQGKEEEEQLKFTPEGEDVGYISLDAARVLALRPEQWFITTEC